MLYTALRLTLVYMYVLLVFLQLTIAAESFSSLYIESNAARSCIQIFISSFCNLYDHIF